MPNSPNRFGQWLEATMQSRGLSQADMARQVGVADVQVSRWRRGHVPPSVRYLHRLASTFDVPRSMLDQLAGYPADEPEQNEGFPEVNPQTEAAIQAYQARYRENLTTQVPRRLWDAYAKACEALAEQLAASFDENHSFRPMCRCRPNRLNPVRRSRSRTRTRFPRTYRYR